MAPDSERIGYVIGLLFGAAMLFAFLVFAIVAIVKAITRRTAGWIIAGIIGGLFLAAPALLIFSAQSADFFLPLFGAQAKRYVRRLGRLQERLGRYNDAATTRQLLAGLHVDAMSGAAREAMGVVLGWQACHLVCGERDLRSVWRAFRRSAEPWSGHA